MTRVQLHTDHPTITYVPVTSLTKSHTGGAAQLSTWPGMFVAPNGSLRTQQVGTQFTVDVPAGTRVFTVYFEDPGYSTFNGLDKRWSPRPGYWRARRTVTGVVGPWFEVLRPRVDSPLAFHDVDPAYATRWEIGPHHPTDARYLTSAFETWRQPEAFPDTEQGGWQQIRGFGVESASATFNTVTYAQTALNVVVYGDSNAVGVINPANDSTDVDYGQESTALGIIKRGRGGAASIWWRQALDAWCEANNRRLVLHNPSGGGLFWTTTTTAERQAILGAFPAFASDFSERLNRITGYSTGDGSMGDPFVFVGQANPGGWVPDVAIIVCLTNDQQFELTFGGSSSFSAAGIAQATEDNIDAMRALWPDVSVYAANTHMATAPGSTAKAGFESVFTGGGAYAADLGVRYVDLYALEPNAASSSGHMTKAQHDLLVTATNASITATLDNAMSTYTASLDFSNERNSMYAAGAFPG